MTMVKKNKQTKNTAVKKASDQSDVDVCSLAGANFSVKFTFELPKQTPNELRFGLILFKMISHHVVLQFCLKHIRPLEQKLHLMWHLCLFSNDY